MESDSSKHGGKRQSAGRKPYKRYKDLKENQPRYTLRASPELTVLLEAERLIGESSNQLLERLLLKHFRNRKQIS